MSLRTSSRGESLSTVKWVRIAVAPERISPRRTEPFTNQSNATRHFAFENEIFIMCAYRASWVSSQKPTPMAI